MIKKTDEITNKIERVPFDLKLPDSINVAPWASIDLPRNKVVHIYEVVKDKHTRQGYAQVEVIPNVKYYDVYVCSKKHGATGADQYNRSNNSFETMPALKHYLLDLANQLNIKRSTIKKVLVTDLQSTDDDDE